MQQDGYLLIRKLRDPKLVLAARRAVLDSMNAKGLLKSGTDVMDGLINPDAQRASSTGVRANEEYRQLPAVQAVFTDRAVPVFFDRFLGAPSGSFDFQWMRVEIMRMIRRGHCLTCKPGVCNEIRFVNQLFHVAA